MVDAHTEEDDACTRRVVPDQETLLSRIALMLTEERQRITRDVRREGDRALHGTDQIRTEIRNELQYEFNRMREEIHDEFTEMRNENMLLKENIHDELVKLRDENRCLKEEIRRVFRGSNAEHHSDLETHVRTARPCDDPTTDAEHHSDDDTHVRMTRPCDNPATEHHSEDGTNALPGRHYEHTVTGDHTRLSDDIELRGTPLEFDINTNPNEQQVEGFQDFNFTDLMLPSTDCSVKNQWAEIVDQITTSEHRLGGFQDFNFTDIMLHETTNGSVKHQSAEIVDQISTKH